WLRQRRPLTEKAHLLKDEMAKHALSVELKDLFDWTPLQFAGTDLILLEAFDRIDGTAETIVTRIRLESRVPIIMLADSYSIDQLVAALATGADAIWSLSTPVEVLIARCKALLRRRTLTTSI